MIAWWLESAYLLPAFNEENFEGSMEFTNKFSGCENSHVFSFTKQFSPSESILKDHGVRGISTLPAAAYLEMAIVAARHHACGNIDLLENIRFERPFSVMVQFKIVLL